jgi:very-short-patch-repair endonuclease
LDFRERIVENPEVSQEKAVLARLLRRRSTSAENAAWEILRNRRLLGLKFRRQQVIRGFVADFYCAEHRLIVELDGGIHQGQVEVDRARDEVLELAGFKILRFANEAVTQDRLEKEIQACLFRLPLSGTERG